MNNKNFKLIPFLLLAIAFFSKSSVLQISPQDYYDKYLLNTSQIDILDDEMAHIYINNATSYSYALILQILILNQTAHFHHVFKNSKVSFRSFFGVFDILIVF